MVKNPEGRVKGRFFSSFFPDLWKSKGLIYENEHLILVIVKVGFNKNSNCHYSHKKKLSPETQMNGHFT